LDFKQWGLLAIQDGGRRKPVDTFAQEALIRITWTIDIHRQDWAKMAGRTISSIGFGRDARLEK